MLVVFVLAGVVLVVFVLAGVVLVVFVLAGVVLVVVLAGVVLVVFVLAGVVLVVVLAGVVLIVFVFFGTVDFLCVDDRGCLTPAMAAVVVVVAVPVVDVLAGFFFDPLAPQADAANGSRTEIRRRVVRRGIMLIGECFSRGVEALVACST